MRKQARQYEHELGLARQESQVCCVFQTAVGVRTVDGLHWC